MGRALGWSLGVALVLMAPGRATGDDAPLPSAAERAIAAHDWPSVVTALTPLANDPANASIHFWLSLAHAHTGGTAKALEHVERARTLAPDDPGVAAIRALVAGGAAMDWKWNRLGEDVHRTPEVARAQGLAWDTRFKHLHAEYRTKPWLKSPGALRELSFRASVAFESAIEAAASEEETDHLVLERAGFYALELGHPARAAEHLGRALQRPEVAWETHLHYARALTLLGHHAEAAIHFDHAIAEAPTTGMRGVPNLKAAAASARGDALLQAGRADDAVRAYRHVLTLAFDHIGARRRLADAAFHAGDLELALWGYGEAATIDGDWSAPYGTGRCLQRLGRLEVAERLMRETIAAANAYNTANAKDGSGPYRNVPGPWVHWLARAQWDLGRRDVALKTALGQSFDEPDLPYARWTFQACLEMDDPYGAVSICERIAHHHPAAAIEGLAAVLVKWPRPRFADMQAGRKMPHTFHAHLALASIHEDQHAFATAAEHYAAGDYLKGTWATLTQGRDNGAWAFHHAGRFVEASQAFEAIDKGSRVWRDRARVGRAATLMRRGRAAEVSSVLAEPLGAPQAPNADALRLWAGVASGVGAGAAPVDPFTLLGVVAAAPTYGIYVRTTLPGGALAEGPFHVRPGDRIVRVGRTGVTDDAGIAALRAEPVATDPVKIHLERGIRSLTFEVDLAAAAARVRGAAATKTGGTR